jgi:TRAP-type C4-dicarboxylate transport system permease small subunit
MPKLIRLYIVSCAIGFAIAAAFVAGLIALDVAHLRHLVFGSPMGWLAAGMMVMFNGVVFAGVQFAIAVMRLAEPEDGPRGGHKRPIRVDMTPIPVMATAKGARQRR